MQNTYSELSLLIIVLLNTIIQTIGYFRQNATIKRRFKRMESGHHERGNGSMAQNLHAMVTDICNREIGRNLSERMSEEGGGDRKYAKKIILPNKEIKERESGNNTHIHQEFGQRRSFFISGEISFRSEPHKLPQPGEIFYRDWDGDNIEWNGGGGNTGGGGGKNELQTQEEEQKEI